AFASLDPLAGIDPARAAAFGGRDALAVDNPCRGGWGAPETLAGARHQQGIDPPPGAVVAPPVEIALHCRARREVPRQKAPLTAGRQEIENSVQDRAQVALARPPEPTRRRQQRRDLRPFPSPRIACI